MTEASLSNKQSWHIIISPLFLPVFGPYVFGPYHKCRPLHPLAGMLEYALGPSDLALVTSVAQPRWQTHCI